MGFVDEMVRGCSPSRKPVDSLGGIVSYRWIGEKEEKGERTESIIDYEHSYGIQISNIR